MFREDGTCPVREWLSSLPVKIAAKGVGRLERLAQLGHEMRRPEADYLEEGIYELRWRFQSVNYRLLYFFHNRDMVVLSHGFTKEDRVPPGEIGLALRHKAVFLKDPKTHAEEA